MKKGSLAVLQLILILTVAACDESTINEGEPENIKKMVQEYSVGSFADVSASITSEELLVTDSNNNDTAYDLPNDEFFVSMAPYIDTTHPCTDHSLTGCQGELPEKEFDVHIQDEDGHVVVDETMTTLANGFIDLWLPRDQTYQVQIEYEGKTAEAEISTFEGDATCITTIQLS
ncbi:CueP family metal-binding protein [Natribacillus halophilus]|uniref:Uncharacterized protein n=1 Tax=Natribacillus halophilus TaxID=549003 RepID=A0A1G8PHS4_9BACI|nr:CueP family metal-binding protein [Natribacillus halophilus]SDI91380.1 hypothetical protein SAMN04488123_108121 [Natribacillus halophilus]